MAYTEHDFSLKSGIQEKSAYKKHDYSLKSGFTKILLAPDFPLHLTTSYVQQVWHIKKLNNTTWAVL